MHASIGIELVRPFDSRADGGRGVARRAPVVGWGLSRLAPT